MEPDFDELNELADKGELTPEKLQQSLNAYHEAFRQEFEESSEANPENVDQYADQFFKKNLHSAAAQIVFLAHNAESESVRANLLKYIIERALADSAKDGDPVRDILTKLTKEKA